MAIRKEKSIIDEYRGSIGPTVFTNSLGGATAKSQPKKRGKDSLNAAQREHTGTFSKLNKFLQHATDVINLGYQLPRNAGLSRFNAAVKWHFEKALAKNPEKGIIDFEKLKLSSPIKSTQKAWEPAVSVDESNYMKVSWKLNPLPKKCTQLSDKAIIVVHFEHSGRSRFMCYKDAVRSDLTLIKELPFLLKGKQVHCYMFMISADKKMVSETQYLGPVQLNS